MAPLHIHRQRDHFHCKPFQEKLTSKSQFVQTTLQKLLMLRPQTLDEYTRSGAYKLTCPDCNKAYTGQTGRGFTEGFNGHKNALKTNRNTSNCAKHVLEHSHSFGPIHETMQILQYQSKGAHRNTIERYFIYKEFSENNHLNDECNKSSNRISDALLKEPHQPKKSPSHPSPNQQRGKHGPHPNTRKP